MQKRTNIRVRTTRGLPPPPYPHHSPIPPHYRIIPPAPIAPISPWSTMPLPCGPQGIRPIRHILHHQCICSPASYIRSLHPIYFPTIVVLYAQYTFTSYPNIVCNIIACCFSLFLQSLVPLHSRVSTGIHCCLIIDFALEVHDSL